MRHNKSEWFSRKEVGRKRHVQIRNYRNVQDQATSNRTSQTSRDHYRNVFNLKPVKHQTGEGKIVDIHVSTAFTHSAHNCNGYRNSRDTMTIQSSQPNWYGIKHMNDEKYGQKAYWQSDSLLNCNQRTGHMYCDTTTSFHKQSLDNNPVNEMDSSTDSVSGVRLQSSFVSLDQNNNQVYTNTSIRSGNETRIWHEDEQSVKSEYIRDTRTVTNGTQFTNNFPIIPYQCKRERYSEDGIVQCCGNVGENHYGYPMLNRFEMETNPNTQCCNCSSNVFFIENSLKDVDYRRGNMIATEHEICETTNGRNPILADTDMRIDTQLNTFIPHPQQSLCYRGLQTLPIMDNPMPKHDGILAIPSAHARYVNEQSHTAERCLPHTMLHSTPIGPTHTTFMGPDHQLSEVEHLPDPRCNDSLTTYQLVESVYDIQETSFSNEDTSSYMQSSFSLPAQTFGEQQMVKDPSLALRDNSNGVFPWTKRIINNDSASIKLPLCNSEHTNKMFSPEHISLSKETEHNDDESQKNLRTFEVSSWQYDPKNCKRTRGHTTEDNDEIIDSFDKERVAYDEHEKYSFLPTKRRKTDMFRPWSKCEKTQSSKSDPLNNELMPLNEKEDTQSCHGQEIKNNLRKITKANAQTNKVPIDRAKEKRRDEETCLKPCTNESRQKISNQTECDSNKESLYRVSHINLNLRAIKRSLHVVSAKNNDIKRQGSITSSEEIPTVNVSSRASTDVADPSIKLQPKMNSGKRAVFKAWEEALVTKASNGTCDKSQLNHSIKKNDARELKTEKIKQCLKNRFRKQIDLLKLVDKNIRARNTRNLGEKKDSICKLGNDGVTLNPSHSAEEKSDVSYIHPKLRHKLSKNVATGEIGENIVIDNSENNCDIVDQHMMDNKYKNTEVGNRRSANKGEYVPENQRNITNMRSDRFATMDPYMKDKKIKSEANSNKNKNCRKQKSDQTNVVVRNGPGTGSKVLRIDQIPRSSIKKDGKPKFSSNPLDLSSEKHSANRKRPPSAEDKVFSNIAKNRNEQTGTVGFVEHGNIRGNVNKRKVNDVDTPLCASGPLSPDNMCYAVQSLHGPIVSSTYYKKPGEDSRKMKVIRSAKEDFVGFTNDTKPIHSNSNFTTCSRSGNYKKENKPLDDNNKRENKPSDDNNSICLSVSPNLVIDVSPSLSSNSVNDSSSQDEKLNNHTEVPENKDLTLKPQCCRNIFSSVFVSSNEQGTNEKSEASVPSNLSTSMTDKQIENTDGTRESDGMKPIGFPDEQVKHLSLEMHMKYMHARNDLEMIDGPRPFLPPLPAFVPTPIASPLYQDIELASQTGFVDSYSPTQEDFERYKCHQKHRLCHITSPPMSPPPVTYLYRGDMASSHRGIPSCYVAGQQDVKGAHLRQEPSIAFQTSRNFVSMYNCDSTTQTYDDMIDDVSSTVMFDTNIAQDIDKVIEEVVTKTCESPELETLVTGLGLLSEENDVCTNMEEDLANDREISEYSDSNVENIDMGMNRDTENPVPFHSGVRPKYSKRFPSYYPKAKPEKHTQEFELYKAADKFLADFDRTNKRSCRNQNISKDRSDEHQDKVNNQTFKPNYSQTKSKERVAERLKTIAYQNEMNDINNENKSAGEIEKIGQKTEKPEAIAKLKMSELLKKCKSKIPIFGKRICNQGKMFTMRKQFDKNSRQKFLKNCDKFNYNKTPFIKVENMKSGRKSNDSSKVETYKPEESKPPIVQKEIAQQTEITETSEQKENTKTSQQKEITQTPQPKEINEILQQKEIISTTKQNKTTKQKSSSKKSVRDGAPNQRKHTCKTSQKKTCQKCNKDFENSIEYNRHIKRNHDIPVFCGVCGMSFRYKEGYYRHLKSQMHSTNLKKFPITPNKPSNPTKTDDTNLNDSIISISSETSVDEVSVHYVSSCSEDVFTSPERKVVNIKKNLNPKNILKDRKSTQVKKDSKRIPVQKNTKNTQVKKDKGSAKKQKTIKTPTGKKGVKNPKLQKEVKSTKKQKEVKSTKGKKDVKSLKVHKYTKSPQVQRDTKISHVQKKCTKSTQVQETKSFNENVNAKPAKKLLFCDPCRRFYSKLWVHVKTDKHLSMVIQRKKELRQRKMEEAYYQFLQDNGKTKVKQGDEKKHKACKGNGKTTKN